MQQVVVVYIQERSTASLTVDPRGRVVEGLEPSVDPAFPGLITVLKSNQLPSALELLA